ncbi:MAG TPA: hypothetical protein VLG69_01115 [Candidatus Andersenbacteria bacterium]|nr:hypothetical protein [Candidatus Andersenbacteria bacterium]
MKNLNLLTDPENLAAIWEKLTVAVKKRGGRDFALDLLAEDEGFPIIGPIADLVVNLERKLWPRSPITVDYGMPLNDMIKAAAQTSMDEDVVEQNFPFQGIGILKTELYVRPFIGLTTQAIIEKFSAKGLVPCKIEHMLARAAEDHTAQCVGGTIVCLGSPWINEKGDILVPAFEGACALMGNVRGLLLEKLVERWPDRYRFGAVPKA